MMGGDPCVGLHGASVRATGRRGRGGDAFGWREGSDGEQRSRAADMRASGHHNVRASMTNWQREREEDREELKRECMRSRVSENERQTDRQTDRTAAHTHGKRNEDRQSGPTGRQIGREMGQSVDRNRAACV